VVTAEPTQATKAGPQTTSDKVSYVCTVASPSRVESNCGMMQLGQHKGRSTVRRDLVAKNSGGGYRIGSVKGRSQTKTSSGHFVLRDTKTGKFMNVKSDQAPFKGVSKEKKK
jgi:hypothetical protein